MSDGPGNNWRNQPTTPEVKQEERWVGNIAFHFAQNDLAQIVATVRRELQAKEKEVLQALVRGYGAYDNGLCMEWIKSRLAQLTD